MNNEQKIEMLKKIMINRLSIMEEQINKYGINEVDESEYDVCRMELNGIIDQKNIYKKVLDILEMN